MYFLSEVSTQMFIEVTYLVKNLSKHCNTASINII